ncbi:MAG: hypothetical protein P4L99_02650 [Chthoniobacter sp.]|nr:hypothetical protein [Chthoniobacter sp.]
MNRSTPLLPILLPILLALVSLQLHAATPAQEKAFIDSYRKALEAGDSKTLAGYLLTDGASPDAVEFFKMTQAIDPGAKIVSIELPKPDAAETAKYSAAIKMPDGKDYKLPLKATNVLVIKIETKDANGSSASATSKSPVGEKAGKLVVLIPVPLK